MRPKATRIRCIGKCKPPRSSTWSVGMRIDAVRNGTITLFRGEQHINTPATSTASATTGCKTVCETPPPNLRLESTRYPNPQLLRDLRVHLCWGFRSCGSSNNCARQKICYACVLAGQRRRGANPIRTDDIRTRFSHWQVIHFLYPDLADAMPHPNTD